MDLDLIFVEQFNLFKKEFTQIIFNCKLEKLCNPTLTPTGTRYANLFALLKVASIYGNGDLLENIQQALNRYNFSMPRTLIYLDIMLFSTFYFYQGTEKEKDIEILIQKTVEKHKTIFQNFSCEFNMFYIYERMDCRYDFWKLGWTMNNAEKYIQKYFTQTNEEWLKEDMEEHIEILMCIVAQISSIQRDKICQKKGRPLLPTIIKKLSQKQNADMVKLNNRQKYQKASQFELIQKNLLTEKEFELIQDKIQDQDVLKKLRNRVMF